MKKLFVAALAIASVVACSKDETVSQQSNPQITFEQAFVDNATRAAADPSTTTGSLTAFDVWGFMDNTSGVLFEDEDVTKSGTQWTYANTQYWSPKHHYYFAALAPMNSANVTETLATGDAAKVGLGTVGFTNVDGSEDLLYASAHVDHSNVTSYAAMPEAVKLTFNHLLSKVKFTFSNGFPNENSELIVKDIKMVVPTKGSINLATANPAWTLDEPATNNKALEFGDTPRLSKGATEECATERLTIPANEAMEYKVTFTVELYQGDVLAQIFNQETTVTGVALEIGNAYNFKATLNGSNLDLYPIVFEVEKVEEWIDAGDQAVTLKDVVIENGEQVTLVSDAVASTQVTINNGTLDGAGHTVEAETTDLSKFYESSTLRFLDVNAPATIRNLTIDGNNAMYNNSGTDYGIRGIFMSGTGKVVIDNVQVLNSTYAINTGTANDLELAVSNSTLEGWSSWSGTKSATFTNVYFKSGTYKNARPYNNTEMYNCKFDADFTLDLTKLAADQKVKLVDCYVGTTKITADNVGTVLKLADGSDVSKIEFNTTVANVASGQTVTMTQDGVTTSSVAVNNGTLDGQGNTLTVAATPGNNGIVRPEGTATIKNITIDGKDRKYDTDKGMRAIYITKAGTYTIDNVKTVNNAYAINVNTNADVVLNVSNSVLEDWISYGSTTTATFNNVTFKDGHFQPYGTTVLKNCKFEGVSCADANWNKYSICFDNLAAGETVTFEDCYVNGTKITKDNFATHLYLDAPAGKTINDFNVIFK